MRPTQDIQQAAVALRKESVDRNTLAGFSFSPVRSVALRKESVDRNRILRM